MVCGGGCGGLILGWGFMVVASGWVSGFWFMVADGGWVPFIVVG